MLAVMGVIKLDIALFQPISAAVLPPIESIDFNMRLIESNIFC